RERRDRDLRETEPEHGAAHRTQLRQAELQPDREHQEHDADLAEITRVGIVGHPRERVRPKGDADRQVAEDRRQSHESARDDDHDRRGEQNENEMQRGGHAITVAWQQEMLAPQSVYFCAMQTAAAHAAVNRTVDAKRALALAREVLDTEARAISTLAKRLAEPFVNAVQLILHCRGRVVVSGIGTSGHGAPKPAAAPASAGPPAL